MTRLKKLAYTSEYDGRLEKLRESLISELKSKIEDFEKYKVTNVDFVEYSDFEVEDYFEIINTEDEYGEDKIRVKYTLDEYENEDFEVANGYGYNEYIDLKTENEVITEVISLIQGYDGYDDDDDYDDEEY